MSLIAAEKPAVRPASATTVMIAVVFLLAYSAFGALLLPMAMKFDYACFYLGASLFRDGHRADLYSPDVQMQRWHELVPDKPIVPYVRPPFYVVPQSLIALLPLRQSLWVTTAISVLALGVCLWWIARRFGEEGLILGGLFLPTPLGIASGQDCVVLLILMLASYFLYERGNWKLSGATIGLGLFKFHLLLLIGPVLILTRRWRMLAGFAGIAAAEAIFSLLLIGPAGIRAYINLMLHRNTDVGNWVDSASDAMPNLQGLLLNFNLYGKWTLGAAILLVLVLCAVAAWKSPWWIAWTAALVGSILIVPHVFGYDFTLVLPGLLLCVKESSSKLTRVAAMWLCTPLPYGANMASAPWPALLPVSALILLIGLADEAIRLGHPHGLKSGQREL